MTYLPDEFETLGSAVQQAIWEVYRIEGLKQECNASLGSHRGRPG